MYGLFDSIELVHWVNQLISNSRMGMVQDNNAIQALKSIEYLPLVNGTFQTCHWNCGYICVHDRLFDGLVRRVDDPRTPQRLYFFCGHISYGLSCIHLHRSGTVDNWQEGHRQWERKQRHIQLTHAPKSENENEMLLRVFPVAFIMTCAW